MPLLVHTARASAPLPADALHVSLPGNDATGDPLGHRGIGYVFCPPRALRDQYRDRVAAGKDTDRYWLNCVEYYVGMMRQRYADPRKRPAWQTLFSWERVVLIGEEPEPARCFSSVLVNEVLKKMGATYMGEL